MKKGELCNGECLGDRAYKCGNECIPKTWYGMPDFTCDDSCDHLNKDKNSWNIKSPCGAHCVNKYYLHYSGPDKDAVKCDGECRYFKGKDIMRISSRKTCNGVCLSGDGDEPWFSCKTGDQCFSKEEWCNGVTECNDGTDEANCDICPEIKRCEHENHPVANQTSSNSPRCQKNYFHVLFCTHFF